MKLFTLNRSITIKDVIIALVAAAPTGSVCSANLESIVPISRYTDNGNGTVTDHRTNLMWKQCPEGLNSKIAPCDTGIIIKATWHGALQLAQATNITGFAGFYNWRVPNRNELSSLTEISNDNFSINHLYFFPNLPDQSYWTATPNASDPFKAWQVSYYSNVYRVGVTYKNISANVRLVRNLAK